MKRNERHHLKENELLELASRTRDAIDARQREVGVAAIVVILIAVAADRLFRVAVAGRRPRRIHARRSRHRKRGARRAAAGAGDARHGSKFPDRAGKAGGDGRQVQGRRRPVSVDRCRHVRPIPRGCHAHGARQPEGGGRGVSAGDRPAPATRSTARWRGSAWPKHRRAAGQYDRRSTPTRSWRSRRTGRCRSTAC